MKIRRLLLIALIGIIMPSLVHAQEIQISTQEWHGEEFLAQKPAFKLDESSVKYMNMLDLPTMRKNLETLASSEFEGRSPGSQGGIKTQEFLVKQLKEIGVEMPTNKSYTQDIERYSSKKTNYRFDFEGYNYEEDYGYTNSFLKDSIITTNEIIFVGYGEYSATVNNFANLDITDKVIMFIEGTSYDKWGSNYAINNTREKYLLEKEPKAIISIREGFSSYFSVYGGTSYMSDMKDKESRSAADKIPFITVNERLANKLLEKTGKTVKRFKAEIEELGNINPVTIKSDNEIKIKSQLFYEKTDSKNIIGFIEGTDLKDEYIVLMAHHDHIGKSSYYTDRIYYGADDNASGVSAALEIARILAKAKKEKLKPRRSIIIIFPTAEEESLKGSAYYVKNPLYPINQTKACVNLDMLGRRDQTYADNNNYMYVSKNSSETYLADLIEDISKASPVETKVVQTTTNFSRSDHYNFSQESVPSVMITGGEHVDYHTERDQASAIEYDLLLNRAKISFLTIWELANPKK